MQKYRSLCVEEVSKWQADWFHSLSIMEFKNSKKVHSGTMDKSYYWYVYAYMTAYMNMLLTNPKRSEWLHFGFSSQSRIIKNNLNIFAWCLKSFEKNTQCLCNIKCSDHDLIGKYVRSTKLRATEAFFQRLCHLRNIFPYQNNWYDLIMTVTRVVCESALLQMW